jgi:MFS family permease
VLKNKFPIKMGKCSLGCLHLSPVMLLVYFCVLNILMYLDRGVLSSLLPALQDDSRMHLSDFQSGILGSVFMFGFMIASPIFAYSSQTVHPFNLIAIGIAIWGGAVLFAAVSRRFWTLAAARMLSGIGEASFVCLASPILLSIAPSSKKNLWISIFYSALTIGYALGYVIAPPVKNSFNGWYVVFYFEAVASIPFVLIALFAYKDPKLIFKKDNKVPISVQFKILKRKPVFVLLVLGYGAYSFTVGGIAHWGPTMLQKQFSKGETTATFSLGAITIISGLFATVLGSVIYEKMIKPYRLQFENREIESRKYDYFRTEKAAKFALLVTSIACAIGCIGAIIAPTLGDPVYEVPFVVFLFCVALAEFSLFL